MCAETEGELRQKKVFRSPRQRLFKELYDVGHMGHGRLGKNKGNRWKESRKEKREDRWENER